MFDIGEVIERTIIGIEQQNGRKAIHYYAYSWYADDSSGTPYRFCEYTGFIKELEKVLKYGVSCYEGVYQEYIKQYIADCNEKECVLFYSQYDNGKQPKFISEKDVSMKTPYGIYVLVDTPSYDEINSVLMYGDCIDLVAKNNPVNFAEFEERDFDDVEHRLFDVMKEYAEILGLSIITDDEDSIDYCTVKAVEESIFKTFEDAGIKFIFKE